MRVKIKLVNFCVRHFCSRRGNIEDISVRKRSFKKIIRATPVCNARPKRNVLTSNKGFPEIVKLSHSDDRRNDKCTTIDLSENSSKNNYLERIHGLEKVKRREHSQIASGLVNNRFRFIDECRGQSDKDNCTSTVFINKRLKHQSLKNVHLRNATEEVHDVISAQSAVEGNLGNVNVILESNKSSIKHDSLTYNNSDHGKSEFTNNVENKEKENILSDMNTSITGTCKSIIDGINDLEQNVEQSNEFNEGGQSNESKAFNDSRRVNKLNMQMLSKRLYERLFKNAGEERNNSEEEIKIIKQDLRDFGINVEDATFMPDVDIDLPPLEGQNVEEHFYNIGNVQVNPYLTILNEIIKDIPKMPTEWLFREGWTRYTENGAESVDYPSEDGLFFDVEVCNREGPLPTLATAVSRNAWYGWVSKSLAKGSSSSIKSNLFTNDMLIPLESALDDNGKKLNDFQKKPKIVVGHNVSYDRIRIKEQYWLNCTGTRFVDTMSLHICVSGINSYQRAVLKSDDETADDEQWRGYTSLNSLLEVYKLYCNQEIDKKSRDVFIEGSLSDVREQYNDLMTYCASDVLATHDILKNLFPLFRKRFPHPVTLAGMLELGLAYLPINSNWQRYLEESQSTYEDLNYEAKVSLSRRADEVCRLMHNENFREDLWMWDQDWNTQRLKIKATLTKAQRLQIENENANRERALSDFESYATSDEEEEDPLEKKFSYLNDIKYRLPVKMPHMPGYPNWYRKLCPKESDENWEPGPQNITTSMQIAPKLLNLTWENYPLHYIREHGWGFLVPYANDPDIVETKLPLVKLLAQCPLPKLNTNGNDVDYAMATLRQDVQDDLSKTQFWHSKKKKKFDIQSLYKGTGIWCNVDIDNCCWFFKLPHKDGASRKVGNPLAKDFLNKFSENVLAGLDASASKVLRIARNVSYWRNNRDRISSQVVVWLSGKQGGNTLKRDKKQALCGAIIPQVIVSGTLTRRAVEPTWMTASNASAERVGSELRAMIQAPLGYNIVGADVDSQELWIASVIGDAHRARLHGATPFGWMTLIGNKSNGTDMHSMTAKAVGISRDHAKIINYARIYGAGQKFAERLLKQFNPSMTDSEAMSKSRKMFTLTKGKKMYKLKSEYSDCDLEDRYYSNYEALKISKLHGKTVNEMFGKGQWIGGSESAMFNRLEEIAGQLEPVTPFLNAHLSRALAGSGKDEDKFLPTKVNWVVQSGAVDFLHLMLVCMRWLMKDNARFCLSFHDEIRYLVPSRHKYTAALAMHTTNLMTRSFCASRLGVKDLPMSVAFFVSVEVDTVLRKESAHDCKTPSNPHGLEKGYGIPVGESLNIWKALEKSGGSLGLWHGTKSRKKRECSTVK
ncbi:DNA polymerase subunit gamma-1, mitochondrial [Orussus abietinus]|uniref:DNA polymerase subunit gamma-1, mitochondrial n=1 Tax=Orussus abietinus TaxID=222816 RepID=UPI000624F475|nr:DNA polymerase subunit gamma-1, mitochondrial [Orussus abietinus]